MPSQRLHSIRTGALVLTVALLAAACGGGDTRELGVGVEDISTDIGLGIEDEAFDAAPANTLVKRPPPAAAVPKKLEAFKPAPKTGPAPDPGTFELFECKEAGPFDFPKQRAETSVTNQRPREGTYPWYTEGTIKTEEGPVNLALPEGRSLGNVREDPTIEGAFLFDVFQAIFLGDFRDLRSLQYQVTSYVVFTESPSQSADVESDQAEGVYIEQVLTFGTDEDGEPFFRRFRPKPPVLILPFPAQPGESWDSTGVDYQGAEAPAPGQVPPTPNPTDDRVMSLRVQGQISEDQGGKEHVDACGEKVDSWLVNSTRTFTVTNPTNGQSETTASAWDYNVATQFGGMIVQEKTKTPPDGPIVDIHSRLARIEPIQFEEASGEVEGGGEG